MSKLPDVSGADEGVRKGNDAEKGYFPGGYSFGHAANSCMTVISGLTGDVQTIFREWGAI